MNGDAAAITTACAWIGVPFPSAGRRVRLHSSPCRRISSILAKSVAAWLASFTIAALEEEEEEEEE
jgi:hypothetical protein